MEATHEAEAGRRQARGGGERVGARLSSGDDRRLGPPLLVMSPLRLDKTLARGLGSRVVRNCHGFLLPYLVASGVFQ
jgi:hypothetical protein